MGLKRFKRPLPLAIAGSILLAPGAYALESKNIQDIYNHYGASWNGSYYEDVDRTPISSPAPKPLPPESKIEEISATETREAPVSVDVQARVESKVTAIDPTHQKVEIIRLVPTTIKVTRFPRMRKLERDVSVAVTSYSEAKYKIVPSTRNVSNPVYRYYDASGDGHVEEYRSSTPVVKYNEVKRWEWRSTGSNLTSRDWTTWIQHDWWWGYINPWTTEGDGFNIWSRQQLADVIANNNSNVENGTVRTNYQELNTWYRPNLSDATEQWGTRNAYGKGVLGYWVAGATIKVNQKGLRDVREYKEWPISSTPYQAYTYQLNSDWRKLYKYDYLNPNDGGLAEMLVNGTWTTTRWGYGQKRAFSHNDSYTMYMSDNARQHVGTSYKDIDGDKVYGAWRTVSEYDGEPIVATVDGPVQEQTLESKIVEIPPPPPPPKKPDLGSGEGLHHDGTDVSYDFVPDGSAMPPIPSADIVAAPAPPAPPPPQVITGPLPAVETGSGYKLDGTETKLEFIPEYMAEEREAYPLPKPADPDAEIFLVDGTIEQDLSKAITEKGTPSKGKIPVYRIIPQTQLQRTITRAYQPVESGFRMENRGTDLSPKWYKIISYKWDLAETGRTDKRVGIGTLRQDLEPLTYVAGSPTVAGTLKPPGGTSQRTFSGGLSDNVSNSKATFEMAKIRNDVLAGNAVQASESRKKPAVVVVTIDPGKKLDDKIKESSTKLDGMLEELKKKSDERSVSNRQYAEVLKAYLASERGKSLSNSQKQELIDHLAVRMKDLESVHQDDEPVTKNADRNLGAMIGTWKDEDGMFQVMVSGVVVSGAGSNGTASAALYNPSPITVELKRTETFVLGGIRKVSSVSLGFKQVPRDTASVTFKTTRGKFEVTQDGGKLRLLLREGNDNASWVLSR